MSELWRGEAIIEVERDRARRSRDSVVHLDRRVAIRQQNADALACGDQTAHVRVAEKKANASRAPLDISVCQCNAGVVVDHSEGRCARRRRNGVCERLPHIEGVRRGAAFNLVLRKRDVPAPSYEREGGGRGVGEEKETKQKTNGENSSYKLQSYQDYKRAI